METSAISGTSAANTYLPPSATGAGTGPDFASVLASQSITIDPNDTSTVDAAEKGLTAYNPGQVTALGLQGEDPESVAGKVALTESGGAGASGEGEAASETSSSSGAGYPAEPGSEWTPGHMQFYDEVFGRWVDDNIPHRVNENGDLEYQYEGEWYLDVAVRHRILDEEGNVLAYMDESGQPVQEGSAETAAGEAEASGEGEDAAAQQASFQVDQYFNETLQAWKIFNFPSRINADGQRQYYWADAWHEDNWQHRAGGSTTQVASNEAAPAQQTGEGAETGSSAETGSAQAA